MEKEYTPKFKRITGKGLTAADKFKIEEWTENPFFMRQKQPAKTGISRFISRLFCSHDYEIISQFQMKSEFDIVVASGITPTSWNSLTRTVVTDYKCRECKKMKRLTVKTARS